MRVPTPKQYARLRTLASGHMVLVPGRREWGPLVAHGWVAGVIEDNGARFLPPLRITPAGLIALAAAVERHGLPEISGSGHHRQLDEPAFLAKLRRDLDEARAQRDEARRQAAAVNYRLARIGRAVGLITQEVTP